MTALAERGSEVDLVTVQGGMKDAKTLARVGGAGYLAELADAAGTAANAGHYAEAVLDKSKRRQLITAGLDIARKSANGFYDTAQDAQEGAEQAIYQLRQIDHRGGPDRFTEAYIKNFLARLEARMASPGPNGTPTGLTDLDDLTGGFQAGDLIVIAGRPSMGKTALALNFTVNAIFPTERETAQDIPRSGVALFSLEMSREQIYQRLLARQAGVDLHKLRNARLLDEQEIRTLHAAAESLGDIPLEVDDRAGLSLPQITAEVRRIQTAFKREDAKLGLVVIDYLQLMSGKGDNREQEISAISRGLKALAKDFEVPVVALSQLNRQVESRVDKRPVLADLRESGAIEQDADLIMFVYREEVYSQKTEARGHAQLLVRKHRQGPCKDLSLEFLAHLGLFRTP